MVGVKVKTFPVSDSILVPLAPTITGAIAAYLQSIARSLDIHLSQNCDNVDTEVARENLDWHWHCHESIRQVPTLQYQYVSTIAHRLSAKSSFIPVEICQALHRSIAITPVNPGDRLSLRCWYNGASYIYFELTPQAIGRWLNYVRDLSIVESIELCPQPGATVDVAIYARARCRSLLQLAQIERIVELTDSWQLSTPNCSIDNSDENLYLVALASIFEHVAEKRLIQVLMMVLDQIYGYRSQIDRIAASNSIDRRPDRGSQSVKSPNWSKLTIDLAQAWLEFYRYCRIFGDVKSQNPRLAIARCGLTAIAYRYLHLLLNDYLGANVLDEL